MRTEVPLIEKNIVLVGFMGVGKTSIGQALAKKMYRDFIDIDAEIEAKLNMSIPTIFEKHGEAFFRQHEKEAVFSACNKKLKIISLGGGAFTQEAIRQRCLANCIVIHLDLSFESWKDRVHMLIDNRPILQGKTMPELKQLYTVRRKAYENYHSRFSTDAFNVDEAAEYLKESLHLAYEIEG